MIFYFYELSFGQDALGDLTRKTPKTKFSLLFLCSNTQPASRLSDDPFVTCDDNLSTNTSTPTSLKKQDSIESSLRDVSYNKRNSKSLPVRNDGTLDYDGALINFPGDLRACHEQSLLLRLQPFTKMNRTTIYRWSRMDRSSRICCLR